MIQEAKDTLLEAMVLAYADDLKRRWPDELGQWERRFAPIVANRFFGTLANLVSVIRVLLAAIVLLLTINYYSLLPLKGFYSILGVIALTTAFIIYIPAGLLDIIDGPLARALNQTSEAGKILDPAADKILLASVALLAYEFLSPYIFWTVVAQESFLIMITLAKIAARKLPFEMACGANNWGKRKAFCELLGGGFLFLSPVSWPAVVISNILFAAAVPLALGSIYGYLSSVKRKQQALRSQF